MDIVADNLSTDVLKARLVLVNGKDVVEYFEEVLDTRLSAGVKFVGEYDSLDVAPKVNGGIVIVRTKDYIYSETQEKWHEIGDEGQIGVLTQAVQALSNSLSDYQPAGDYALKSDIPTAAEISTEISLSDYIKEVPTSYKTYAETKNVLSNDGYALKTDISAAPTAAEISAEIHLSDYSLISHNHDGTYLKEVPAQYKTYDQTKSILSADGYALKTNIPSAAEISAEIHLSDYVTEIPDTYKTYVETANSLSNDGYALKTDIPSAATISNEISLSDYSLTSHNHDGTYLKEVPAQYKTYDQTKSSLSTDGYASTESLTAYAKTSDLSDLPAIKQDIINLGAVSSDFQLTAEAGSMAYESKDNYLSAVPNSYKTYNQTKSDLSNDGYALKTDIPTADDISSEIHLSDYSLTSHNHDGTYLKEVPVEYKTYDDTVSSLSVSGYALKQWVEDKLSDITTNIDALSSLVTAANNSLETILNESL